MAFIGEPYNETYFFNSIEGYTNYGDLSTHPMWVNIANDIESQIGSVSGLDILDAGCAFGYLANELSNRGASVTGVDLSSYAITQAQTLYPSLTFDVADATISGNLPYGNNAFDLIVSVGLADCMPDDTSLNSLLQELNRVLHPQGSAYILGSNRPSDSDFIYKNISPNEWEQKVLGNRSIVASDVSNIDLFWEVRVVIE